MPQRDEREGSKIRELGHLQSNEHPAFGFANLPNEIHRNAVKKGFEFTLMVVGESGMGKSTLIDSLFLIDLYKDRELPSAERLISRTTEIRKSSIDIEERGVKLRLHVIDTPGFGDAVRCTGCHEPIVQYIDEQFERYLSEESGLHRRNLRDTRVHCLFYFVAPHQRGLKPLDLRVLSAVHTRVNVVMLIAKADTLTRSELETLKRALREQLTANRIRVYELPQCADDEDDEFKQQCVAIRAAMPFAVVGASCVINGPAGRRVRGRSYDFGFVDVDNSLHCDTAKLRTLLVTHMQDMHDVTHEVLYENFRVARLTGLTNADSGACTNSFGTDTSHNRVPSEVTPSKNLSGCSEGSSLHSVASSTDVERQLLEKETELRRMRDLLAKLQPTGTISSSELVSLTSMSAIASSSPSSLRDNVTALASNNNNSTTIPCSTPNCVPRTQSSGTFAQGNPSALTNSRNTTAYASFNVSHSYSTLQSRLPPSDDTASRNIAATITDMKRNADDIDTSSLLSRAAVNLAGKKAPPVVSKSGIFTFRKQSSDASADSTANSSARNAFVL